ncbi:hypothetical protein ACHAXT_010824 [Thalassiosira profunda]
MPSEHCVSVHARVRRSARAIDPEFDPPRDTLVSFVDHPANNKDNNGSEGPSLVLTPAPAMRRSVSRGNMAPVKRRHRSFSGAAVLVGVPGSVGGLGVEYAKRASHGSSLHSAGNNAAGEVGSVTSDGEGMVDVSLDEGGEAVEPSPPLDRLNASHNSGSHPLLPPTGLPAGPSAGGAPGPPKRYSSPFAVHRTSSGTGSVASAARSDTHAGGSVRSRASSRSRSRSRSARRMGGHLRMRSMSAASAFATASQAGAGENELEAEGAEALEPIVIPLKEILSVDEEVPSRKKGSRGGGSNAGGSDFYCSAASDAEAAKEATDDVGGDRSPMSPPPATNQSGKVPHRIFLHTLGNGYVEFSLENANSHDVFLAYLKAHLEPDRIPNREHPNRAPPAGGLRTMVLTPTKEVPSNLSGSASGRAAKADDDNDTTTTASTMPRTPSRSALSIGARPGIVSRSRTGDSTVGSRDIDRLHSRAIKRRLKAEATPFMRFKERVADMVSSVIDCACCQDTTVAPLEEESQRHSLQSKGSIREAKGNPGGEEGDKLTEMRTPERSPRSARLWATRGIGGLSFEESCGSTPKLSFEKSVDRG